MQRKMSKAEALASILAAHGIRGPRGLLSNADGTEVELIVSVVEDVVSFFGLQPSDTEEVVGLAARLAEFCPTAPPVKNPECNKVYAAVYSKDGKWYRCKVLKKLDCTKSYVQYLDYGNCEERNHEQDLVIIPNELSEIRPLAIFCTFDGLVGLREDDNPAAFRKAMRELQKLLTDKTVVVKTKGPFSVQDTNFVTSCRLLDSGKDIVQELINQGYCQKTLAANKDSTEVNIKESAAPSMSLLSKDFQWRPNQGSDSVRDGSQGYSHGSEPGLHSGLCASLKQQPAQLPGPGVSPTAGFIPKLPMDPQGEHIALSKQLEAGDNSAASVEQLRSELNQLQVELEAKKSQIKVLQRQVASKGNVGESFTSQLQGLIALVEKVSLQRKKFSADPCVKDVIEEALDVHSSFGWITEPIHSVETAIAHHQAAQEAIGNCVEKDQLEVLVAKRDAAFNGLLQELQPFKEVSEEAEQTVDVQRVESALGELKRVYGVLLKNSGDLSSDTNSVTLSMNDCYQILKQKEGPDICKLRQQTESAQRNLAAGLQELQQVLLGVTADSSGKDFFLNDLDTSMAHFHISVEDEMSAYNLLFSDSHGPIATLVRRLVAALQDIIDQAASSSSVQSRYRSLLWEIFEQKESWHNIQQKAREASQLHKDLRKLKSALRHRLVDFEDAEEDQEVAAKVAADINAIRDRILASYIEQELLMVELCQAHNRRFPELAVLYPELDFPLHQKYNCLLKPDWDLYTFSVKKSGCVLKTTFANDDMIIAEYALDRPEDLDKLLVKASDYNLVSSPHLIRIKAVFQSKDQCHAYLLMPDIGTPMAELGRPVPHLVLQQVLSALSALHAKTPNKPAIPHGHIHPGWLLVPASDRPVCLGLPNFQLGKSYQLPLVDGIDFTAPELRYSNAEPTPASDMFAFGCLMLWVLYPEAVRRQSFPSSLDSVREMQQREKEDLVIIQSLVNKEPRLRPTTAELLLRPFFASLVSQHDTASGAPSFGMPT